jgi:hypothetical protein
LAQRDLGTITGTITDAQGGAVPGAKVTLTEDATGLKYTVETGSGGEFGRPALKPGIYTVEVEAKGFKKSVQKGAIVTSGDRLGVNLTLEVGEVTQSVEVTEQVPLLQTESNILGADIATKQVAELPLGGQRTFTFLARLSPGVVPAEPGARDAVGGGFSANGVRSNGQNNFLLNGVDNNVNVIDFLNQTAFVVGPSVEAISEMRVMTNGYGAEYGRGAGGVMNVSLKSGTNEIHGAAFEYLQNKALDANRWEDNLAGKTKGPFKQNQYGGAIGGPAIKNRTFWFADWQGTKIRSTGGAVQNLGTSGFFTVPTPDMINGNFANIMGGGIGNVAGVGSINSGEIFDPNSTRVVNGQTIRTPYTGNIIPASQFDPAAHKIMQVYPAPNQPIVAGGIPQNDYFTTTSGKQDTWQYDIRVDHRLTEKDSLFGSVSWADTNKFNEAPLPGALDATMFNSNSEQDLSRNAMLSYTRVWTPAILSETRVAYTRLVTARLQAYPNTDQFAAFGIGGYNPTTVLNGGLPQTGLDRYTQIGASDWLPSKEYSNVWDFIQNVAINKGAHAYKFGAEYRPIKFPFFQVPAPHGEMNIRRIDTSLPQPTGSNVNYTTLTGDETASYLLGWINYGEVSTNNFISSQKSAWGFYGQDDWKVNSKLTINYGIRYELFTPIDEKFGRQSNFVLDDLTLYIPKGKDQAAPLPPSFATQFPQVTVSRGQIASTLIDADKWDFGPRIGFAYSAFHNTVLRAGYGIFYGGEENQGGNPNRGESAPFNETVLLNNDNVYARNPFFTGGVAGGYPSDVFTMPAPIQFREVATNFRNGLVHKWNAAIQREFRGNLALEVSYVGNHQSHQLLQPDFNRCPNSPLPNISCDSRRPYPNIGNIQGTASFGYGNYDGMTLKLEKRMSKGLTFMGAYTYGHSLATSGTTLTGSAGLGTIDPTNLSKNYSSASWDIRQNFVFNGQYDVPIGRGRQYGGNMNKLADAFVGGWQMNTIITMRTGVPYTLRSSSCIASVDSCFPDLVSGKNPNAAPSGGRTPSQWFDTSAVTNPAPGTEGNLGMQSNTGPSQFNYDFSMFKGFSLTERYKIQYRCEFFNIFNHPQYNTPDNNNNDGNFGAVTSTLNGSERRIQMALRFQF